MYSAARASELCHSVDVQNNMPFHILTEHPSLNRLAPHLREELALVILTTHDTADCARLPRHLKAEKHRNGLPAVGIMHRKAGQRTHWPAYMSHVICMGISLCMAATPATPHHRTNCCTSDNPSRIPHGLASVGRRPQTSRVPAGNKGTASACMEPCMQHACPMRTNDPRIYAVMLSYSGGGAAPPALDLCP